MVAPDLMTAADVAAASKGQVSAADPRLPALIAAASQAVRDRCGWHVTPVVSETLTVDGTGGVLLDVRSGRLLGVSEVRVGGVPVVFDWSADGIVERRDGVFPRRFRSVEVDVRHGFEQAPALVQVAVQAVLGACASPLGATREQAGQVAISWGRTGLAVSEEDMASLAPYRLQMWA